MCIITDIRVNEDTAKIIDERFDNFYLLEIGRASCREKV